MQKACQYLFSLLSLPILADSLCQFWQSVPFDRLSGIIQKNNQNYSSIEKAQKNFTSENVMRVRI
jgi:hypothetical protein